MPAIHGGLDEGVYETFQKMVVDSPNHDNESAALRFCVEYTLKNKYGVDISQVKDTS